MLVEQTMLGVHLRDFVIILHETEIRKEHLALLRGGHGGSHQVVDKISFCTL
jgi:hypothetical protein